MKKGLTELVFILDRSGSMAGLETDTIGGFNGMIEKQKKTEGEATVTTVLFDDQYELIHDRFPLSLVSPLTEKDYYVRGCTALLDAVGKTIQKIKSVQEHLPKEARAEKVIFVITTDGMENSSQEYTYDRIRSMIESQKEKGWEFLFLGANIDAVSEAAKFGIHANRSVRFKNDSAGVKLNYQVVSETLSCMRMAPACAAPIDASWKKSIEEDYEKREAHKKSSK